MFEILKILKGRVSVGLNGIAVLHTMVERLVQLLKLWARLLCDYVGVRDLSWETMEMLEASEVMKQVNRLVTPTTIVMVENVMEAFSATYQPNLVNLSFPFISSFHSGPLILLVLFS